MYTWCALGTAPRPHLWVVFASSLFLFSFFNTHYISHITRDSDIV